MISINYQLRVWNQESVKIMRFEAHYERTPNTHLCNVSTEPDTKTFHLENLYDKSFHQEKVQWTDLISKDRWDDRQRSDKDGSGAGQRQRNQTR